VHSIPTLNEPEVFNMGTDEDRTFRIFAELFEKILRFVEDTVSDVNKPGETPWKLLDAEDAARFGLEARDRVESGGV